MKSQWMKPQKMFLHLHVAALALSVREIKASSIEYWALKPNWYGDRILNLFKCLINCPTKSFCHNLGSSYHLSLSPFLKNKIILAFFIMVRNIPCSEDKVNQLQKSNWSVGCDKFNALRGKVVSAGARMPMTVQEAYDSTDFLRHGRKKKKKMMWKAAVIGLKRLHQDKFPWRKSICKDVLCHVDRCGWSFQY